MANCQVLPEKIPIFFSVRNDDKCVIEIAPSRRSWARVCSRRQGRNDLGKLGGSHGISWAWYDLVGFNVNPGSINHGLWKLDKIRGYSPNSHFIWYLNGIEPSWTIYWTIMNHPHQRILVGYTPSWDDLKLHTHRSGWWLTYPSEKIWKSDWLIIPAIGENNPIVPNHQPG
jgi:hypothetical protein